MSKTVYAGNTNNQYNVGTIVKEVTDHYGQSVRVTDTDSIISGYFTHFRATYNGSNNPTEVSYYRGTEAYKTTITFSAAATLNNKYFVIHSAPSEQVYVVWFDVDGTGSAPVYAGTKIRIQVSVADSAEIVAAMVKLTIDSLYSDVFTTGMRNGASLEIATTELGEAPDSFDVDTGFAFSLDQGAQELVTKITITYSGVDPVFQGQILKDYSYDIYSGKFVKNQEVTITNAEVSVELDYLNDSVTSHQGGAWSVSVNNLPAVQTVSATDLDIRNLTFAQDKTDVSGSSVSITNFPATQNVTASDLDIRDLAFAQDKVDVTGSTVSLSSGSLAALESTTVQNGAGASAVNIQDGGNSITVDGTVSVGNFPATQVVSGTVTANAGTGTFAVSGPLTDTQLRATAVPVSGTFFQATQPVSGTVTISNPGLTDAQIRATPLPISGTVSANATLSAETTKVIGTVNISSGQSVTANAGTNLNTSLLALDSTVAKDASLTTLDTSVNTLLKPASTLAAVTSITNAVTIKADTPANQANALKVDGTATTQPISAAALPLPSGASTSALQTTGNSSLSSIDTKLPALVSSKVPVLSTESTPSTAVVTSLNALVTNQTALSANANRRSAIFYRSGAAVVYIKFGATATTSDYTIQLVNNAVYELPFPCYTGRIDVIFAGTTGTLKITEIT